MNRQPTTLREKAAQLVFARIGSNMQPPVAAEDDAARVKALIERCPIGGLLLFNGSAAGTPSALVDVQASSPFPLLVASDIERGAGQQLAGATVFPHAMAFGACGDEAERLVEEAASATAREALACGTHIAFAPVADVHLEPRNPIISTRAFSDDPARAACLVRAYVRGAHAEGLLTTAKHFPGHGRTRGDSHAELPTIETSREELETADLAPFRAAIREGVDLMMTAHVAYPALDDRATTATRSRPILHNLLREQMGFGGVVVTDSLLMEAVRPTPEAVGEQAAALLRAGVDVLLDPDDPGAVVSGLVRAVEEETLDEARIDEAFGRVWRLKERVQARHPAAFAPSVAAWGEVDTANYEALAREVAREAFTVLDAAPGAWPLDAGAGDDLLIVRVDPKAGPESAAAQSLARIVHELLPDAAYRVLDPEAANSDALLQEAQQARHVVLTLVVEPAAWQDFGLTPAQIRFARALTEERTVVAAALGSPHILDEIPQAAARLCTYSDTPPAQTAFVEALADGPGDRGRRTADGGFL